MTAAMTDVDDLARLAVELVTRVRDDNPDANARWLTAHLPNPADWFRLAFVLAAAVPDDRSWQALTAWTGEPPAERRLQPHGTAAAARRHRYHGEALCEDCRNGERFRDRARKQAGRPPRPELRPHGTAAAASRHRYRQEPLCDQCRQAEQARDWARHHSGALTPDRRTA